MSSPDAPLDLMPVKRRPSGARIVLTVLATLLAAPVAAWWVIGDLSEEHGTDYLYRAPHVDSGAVRIAGAVAVLIVAVSVWSFVIWTRRRLVPRSWWSVEGTALFAGFATGYGLRIVTAGVSGANIGGGMVILFWPVMFLGAVVWSTVQTVHLLKAPK